MATVTINRLEQEIVSSDPNVFEFDVINSVGQVSFTIMFQTEGREGTIDWGDGTVTEGFLTTSNRKFEKNYQTAYTGKITVTFNAPLNDILSFTTLRQDRLNPSFDLSIFQPLNKLNTVHIQTGSITGNVNDLPDSIRDIIIDNGVPNNLSGNIDSFNNNIKKVRIVGSNNIKGILPSTYNNLEDLTIRGGTNEIEGNINDVNPNISILELQGNNTFTGDYSTTNFTQINRIVILGNNTLFGNIDNKNIGSSSFIIDGQNNLSGNFQNLLLPSQNISIKGSNNIVGVISNIEGLPGIEILGNNELIFNLTGYQNIHQTDLGFRLIGDPNLRGCFGDLGLVNMTELGEPPFALPNFRCSVSGQLTYTRRDWSVSNGSNNPSNLNIEINAQTNPEFVLTPTEVDNLIIDIDNSDFKKSQSNLNFSNDIRLTGGFSRTSATDEIVNRLTSENSNFNIVIN